MNLISKLENVESSLKSNQERYKKIYQESCEIEDAEEFDRISQSSRKAIMLFKKWLNVLQPLKSELEANKELIVDVDETEAPKSVVDEAVLNAKVKELTQQLQNAISERDDLKSKLEIANQTIKEMEDKKLLKILP